MSRGIKVAALMAAVLLMGRLVFAQDPLEVGPNIYKLIFENERVRVMELTFKPGDKIATHSHPDHFVYILSGGKLTLSYPDGSTKDFEGKVGDVVWINAETHAAENVGETEVKGIVVELKEPARVELPQAEPLAEPDAPAAEEGTTGTESTTETK